SPRRWCLCGGGVWTPLHLSRLWRQVNPPPVQFLPPRIPVYQPLEVLQQVLLAWLTEYQPVDRETPLEPTELALLATEGDHGHAALDLGAAIHLVNPERCQISRVRRAVFGRSLEQQVPRIALPAPVVAEPPQAVPPRDVLADRMALVTVDAAFALL